MNTTIDIKNLIVKAKALSGKRIKNKGRPRHLMDDQEATIVSSMRKNGCSVSSIYRVMKEEKLTSYDNKQKFSFAYSQYKLHS